MMDAKTDKNFTCFTPKYSLIISVNINIKGQVITPADMLKDNPLTPNKSRLNFSIPKLPSTVKSLTPIISDKTALATKNDASIINKRLSLVLKVMINIICCLLMPKNYLQSIKWFSNSLKASLVFSFKTIPKKVLLICLLKTGLFEVFPIG